MYKLTKFNSVIRVADGACIPFAEGNTDYADYQTWLAAGNTPEPAESRDEIVSRQWEAIKAIRDSLQSGGVLASSKWFQTDVTSRIQWIRMESKAQTALMKGGAGADPILIAGIQVQWKTCDGSFVPVTNDLAIAVVAAVEIFDAQVFTTAETKRGELNAAADPAAYDVSAGWPAVYQEA